MFLMTDMTNIIIVLSVIKLSLYLIDYQYSQKELTLPICISIVFFCDNTTSQFVDPKNHCIIHKGKNLYMHHVQGNVFKNGKNEKT